MRAPFLPLVTLLMCWGCSRNDYQLGLAPAERAASLVGVYDMTYYREDTTSARSAVPATFELATPKTTKGLTYSAYFTVRRDSASVVFITLTETLTGRANHVSLFDQVTVGGLTPPYDLLTANGTFLPVGTKIGTCDGTNFNLDYVFTNDGVLYREIYTARK